MESILVIISWFYIFARTEAQEQTIGSVSQQDEKSTAGPNPPGRVAYVTLLYGSGFELGVRVLGQSLRESGTNIEYICMCTPDVSESTRDVLKKDGWTVKVIHPLNALFQEHLIKMLMWTLTEYRRIVWIDADAIVLQNIDHLFRCGSFCAVYRNSDLFNSGIMVVKPSFMELKQIMRVSENYYAWSDDTDVCIRNIWSDQNILNKFYNTVYRLKYARMFDKEDASYQKEPMRLPAGYNSDVGMYYLNNRWCIPESERYVLHYTLGPTKPFKWWTYPFFDLNWKWYELRCRLPNRYNEYSLWDFSNLLPLFLVLILVGFCRFISFRYRFVLQSYCERFCKFVSFDRRGWLKSVLPLTFAVTSGYFSFFLVPTSITPKSGWFMYIMWLVIFLYLFYGPLCYVLYIGSSKESGYVKKLIESVFYLVVLAMMLFMVIFILHCMISFHFRCIAALIFTLVLLIYCHITGRQVLTLWYSLNSSLSTTVATNNNHTL